MDRSMLGNLWHKVFRSGNPLFLFIGLNALVFVVLNMLRAFTGLKLLPGSIFFWTMELVQLPAATGVWLTRPWTLLTYMVTQIGFFHFLFNMLWLYWLGMIFTEFLSRRQFVFAYLAGGVAGGLFFLLAYNLIPVFAESRAYTVLIGSSASVSAVVFATATLLPDYSIRMLFLGNVKLKYLALAFLVLNLLGIGDANAGGNIAHLGGALLGFLMIRQLQRGHDWSGILRLKRRPRSKLRIASKQTTPQQRDRSTSRDTTLPDQELIDRILDKISQTGYDSLSRSEKETLFKISEKPDKTKK